LLISPPYWTTHTKLRQVPRPIMSSGTGFHVDWERRRYLEELQYVLTPKLLANDTPFTGVDSSSNYK